VQIKARRIWNFLVDKDSTVIVNSNDIKPNILKIVDARNCTKEVLSFMASQGFTTTKLLMTERICDQLTKNGVAYLTSTKQCDIRSFLLPSVMPLIDLNEALE
jgi:hypothetical protein